MGEESCINSGDTTWVLLSSMLVMSMMPALAFFEAGMLRAKNTLSIMTQVFVGGAIVQVMWVFIGYSLVFGETRNGLIGNFNYIFLLSTPYDDCHDWAPTIPAACFAFFEMMFACITPLLATGAFAERLTWKAFFWYIILFETFVYYPIAKMIWGDGWLSNLGAEDFAGGIVIHTTSGTAALITAWWLGQRKEFDHYHGEFPPSNIPLAGIGFALLCTNWLSFNGGSALSAGYLAVSAAMSTVIAAAVGGLTWHFLSWSSHKPNLTSVMNGALAGMAGITPISGYADSQSTIAIAFICGLVSFYGIKLIKGKFKIDDALDVSSVHGLTGVVGSIAIGFCASSEVNPDVKDGLFYGGSAKLLGVQLLAVAFTIFWTALFTFAILGLLTRLLGDLRASEKHEVMGLDYAEHDEVAYHDLFVLESKMIPVEDMNMPLTDAYKRHHRYSHHQLEA